MKVQPRSFGATVDKPDARHRFYLFFGPDGAQARALGARLTEAVGASRFLVNAAAIKADPAALPDEAGALSLFGGKRVVWIDPAAEDVVDGVVALLDGVPPESPVVAIAGDLRPTHALRKLAESSSLCAAFGCYLPSDADAAAMVVGLGRRFGLKIGGDVAARVAAAGQNDQGIVEQELVKLATFLDATPNAPKALDHDALDAVGAESNDGNAMRLADWALAGDIGRLSEELANLSPGGSEAIPVVRALHRRIQMLAPARAKVERGQSPRDVMAAMGKSMFWKDKNLMEQLLPRWDSARLAALSQRVGALERNLLFSPAPERAALGEELVAIARAARRG